MKRLAIALGAIVVIVLLVSVAAARRRRAVVRGSSRRVPPFGSSPSRPKRRGDPRGPRRSHGPPAPLDSSRRRVACARRCDPPLGGPPLRASPRHRSPARSAARWPLACEASRSAARARSTMQVAALVEPPPRRRAGRRSLVAKLRQMREAVAIERRWTKHEILEAYLNLVAFRGELIGVGAATAALFGKAPSGIDATEAAVLAVARPIAERAGRGRAPARSRPRRRCRLAPPAQRDLAAAVARVTEVGPLVDRAGDARASPGGAPLDASRRFDAVRTTIDARVQRLAIEALREQLLEAPRPAAQDGAVLVADNATGDVLAYVGSGDDLSSAPHVDGVRGPRQAGSALKPFLYGRAFDERLLTAASLLEDTQLEVASGERCLSSGELRPRLPRPGIGAYRARVVAQRAGRPRGARRRYRALRRGASRARVHARGRERRLLPHRRGRLADRAEHRVLEFLDRNRWRRPGAPHAPRLIETTGEAGTS